MIPFESAIEAFLVIFNNLPQPIYSFIVLVLVFFFVAAVIRIILNL